MSRRVSIDVQPIFIPRVRFLLMFIIRFLDIIYKRKKVQSSNEKYGTCGRAVNEFWHGRLCVQVSS